MDGLYNLIATIVVAIIGLVGIIIQTKSKEKIEGTTDMLEETNKKIKETNDKIDNLRRESELNDIKINNKLDSTKLATLKIWLTTEMTKIRDGYYKPNEEQKRLLHEAKTEYNNLGGDSYVDDMFAEIKNKKLI